MLTEEITIGIYPDGDLNDILIVPEGHEYHLFLTGNGSGKFTAVQKHVNLGSIVIINQGWIYEGSYLSTKSQQQIADYIICYPDTEA